MGATNIKLVDMHTPYKCMRYTAHSSIKLERSPDCCINELPSTLINTDRVLSAWWHYMKTHGDIHSLIGMLLILIKMPITATSKFFQLHLIHSYSSLVLFALFSSSSLISCLLVASSSHFFFVTLLVIRPSLPFSLSFLSIWP